MYSPSHLARIDATTFRARSESDPEREPYVISIRDRGYACTCPAGSVGRCCKHTRILDYAITAGIILRAFKPDPSRPCGGMDGWCSFPRLLLWGAVRELVRWDDVSDFCPLAQAGLRAMYLCDDCRDWATGLLRCIDRASSPPGRRSA